jgi:hypothetical protein
MELNNNTIVVLNNLDYIPNNVMIKGRYRDISVGIYTNPPATTGYYTIK